MPSLRRRSQQPAPVNPQVPIPNDFPAIPQEILDRFPSAAQWQKRLDDFWARANQAIQEAQSQSASAVNSRIVYSVDQLLVYANGVPMPLFALDATGVRLGDVLVVSTPGRKVFIGQGQFEDDLTPFYVDQRGFFSLGSSLTWNPETDTLTINGTINATTGEIGGFTIGADSLTGPNLTLNSDDDTASIVINNNPGGNQATFNPKGLIVVDQFGSAGFTLQAQPNGDSLLIFHQTNSGVVFLDANLYRSAADVLKTDDSFVVAVDLTAGGVVTFASLAGVGSRAVVADAAGVLSAP